MAKDQTHAGRPSKETLDKLTVLKSNPLTSLWRSEMTLAEFKVLDVYLGRINSHKPEERTVEFTKAEFERLLDVSKFNLKELDERLQHLVSQAVRITDEDYRKGFAWVSLFEEARVELDKEEVQCIYLECTQKAMKYFFNVESLGYLRYKLRAVKDMKSRYTYILFLYLEGQRRMHLSWTVPLNDLKLFLNCENDATYAEYKHFNAKILKRCHQEISEKTECRFTYEPVRRGRRVEAIHFALEPLAVAPGAVPNQLAFDGFEPVELVDYNTELLREACCPMGSEEPEFSLAEIEVIKENLVVLPEKLLPENVPGGDIWLRRYHYLAQRYAGMERQAEKSAQAGRPIQNRFAYLLKMIRKDCA